MDATALAEIRAIEALKARYFRLLDTKQWDAWREVFTEDFEADVDGQGVHPTLHFASRDEMVERNREVLATAPTVHHGHMPEITLTGPDTATGVWAMMDIVRLGRGFRGYGHYHEEYVKQAGEWRIRRMRLTRLLVISLE
ncbi:MAG: nuclear transport factor 2 family protein [Myxococcota bacterium]